MNFYEACKIIGKKYSWVQGTGGNISIKSEDEMDIKASGVAIADISEEYGLVKLDYNKIKHNLDINIENSKIRDTDLRPSMEAGFHSLLGKVVVHTHPAPVLMFACMKHGKEILQNITPLIWVQYETPGLKLALAIRDAINSVDVNKPISLVLENHGLVVSTKTIEENIELNTKIITGAEEILVSKGIELFEAKELIQKKNCFVNNTELVKEYLETFSEHKHLFPDAVVFGHKLFNNTSENMELKNQEIHYYLEQDIAEKIDGILRLHMWLCLNIRKIGQANFLPEQEITKLLNLKAEKYRQEMLK